MSYELRKNGNRSRPLIAVGIATALGVGYVPIAPGTFGSAVGLFVWWGVGPSWLLQAMTIAAVVAVGTLAGTAAASHFGRPDPGEVVIDEVAGMLVTLFLNPVGWQGLVAGFCLFRAADIVKPFPARRLERLPGGLGIMADDLMAAVYANLALRAILATGFLK